MSTPATAMRGRTRCSSIGGSDSDAPCVNFNTTELDRARRHLAWNKQLRKGRVRERGIWNDELNRPRAIAANDDDDLALFADGKAGGKRSQPKTPLQKEVLEASFKREEERSFGRSYTRKIGFDSLIRSPLKLPLFALS